MSYHYDISDFKRYLNDRNPKYRVDGLIFWQNRIPLPIDLFNRIFDDSDQIVVNYVYQLSASVAVFSQKDSFEEAMGVDISDLPKGDLARQSALLHSWLSDHLSERSKVVKLAYEIADILGIEDFAFAPEKVAEALIHQGKKYARIFMPAQIQEKILAFPGCQAIGADNTDMFGNIIADRYDIYRSGFSDALAIIFNALLDFRILCSMKEGHLRKLRVIAPLIADVDVRLGRTSDGSLWEPGYDDDHYVTLNREHPLMRYLSEDQSRPLAEVLFFIGEFENGQFSDESKKLIENLRQTASRSLWIKNDQP
jgi:hypothetical protein